MRQFTVTLTEDQIICILQQLTDTIITIFYLPADPAGPDIPLKNPDDHQVLLNTFNQLRDMVIKSKRHQAKGFNGPQVTHHAIDTDLKDQKNPCPLCTPWQKQSQGEISG
jgi:hypothetical protein